jgi:hypothetical protein
MATNMTYDVEFRMVKAAAGGSSGNAYQYTRPVRRATVIAASAHPHDILAVLNADIAVLSGESIELVNVRSAVTPGSEGAVVLS